MDSESVSSWICQLSQGNQQAAFKLWNRYGKALQNLAKAHYTFALNAVFDEHDLAQSVFMALWQNAEAGRLKGVRDRQELWWMLLEMTRRRAISRAKYNQATKRPQAPSNPGKYDPLPELSDPKQLSPEVLSILHEEHDRIMQLLPDDRLRTIAQLHLEGFSNEEIAGKIELSPRTISRKLKLIRDQWSIELHS